MINELAIRGITCFIINQSELRCLQICKQLYPQTLAKTSFCVIVYALVFCLANQITLTYRKETRFPIAKNWIQFERLNVNTMAQNHDTNFTKNHNRSLFSFDTRISLTSGY